MSAHTPGPWSVEAEGCDITRADGTIVCSLVDDNGQPLGGRRMERYLLGNASLIAAAPELYEALRRIVENPEARIGGDIRAEAVAALAKAKS